MFGSMMYISTRGGQEPVSFYEAIVQGIACDGGLLVPDGELPRIDVSQIRDLNYVDLATEIIASFIPDGDRDLIREACSIAYSRINFPEDVVQVKSIGNMSIAELWHGRTAAFKDMALSLLPHLMQLSRHQLGDQRKVLILTATSGDTGKAALEGFQDVEGTEIIVFYPTDGVSSIQRKQMTSQEGNNVHVFGIKGNFDDAQRSVKKALNTLQQRSQKEVLLSSANSINIGRLLPQIVYYYWSYIQMVKQGRIGMTDSIYVCVPSGNFANCLAAYLAREMGLPIQQLLVASNKNNVLTDFFKTGVYDAQREFYKTCAPAMDILVSSNLERLLWWMSGKNSAQLKEWMRQLNETGKYEIDAETKHKINMLFRAGFTTEEDILRAIKDCWEQHHYLLDTHTACAWEYATRYQRSTGDYTPMLVMSTANPYKFPEAVSRALGGEISHVTNMPVPEALRDIEQRPDRHTDVIRCEDILSTIEQCLNH